jgi:hypothetical protein
VRAVRTILLHREPAQDELAFARNVEFLLSSCSFLVVVDHDVQDRGRRS